MDLRTRTAYREAGHATARIFFDLALEVVSLWRDGRPAEELKAGGGPACGWKYSDAPVGQEAFEKLDSALMAQLAGPCAEDIAAGVYSPAKVPDDEPEIQALVGRLFRRGSPLGRLYSHEAWGRTHQFLQSHWPVVEALAEALLAEGELSPDQARSLANRALNGVWEAKKGTCAPRRYGRPPSSKP